MLRDPGQLRICVDAILDVADERNADPSRTVTVTRDISLRRRGVEAKLVLADGIASATNVDPALCGLVAEARQVFELLASEKSP